jgi:hypothetical protein
VAGRAVQEIASLEKKVSERSRYEYERAFKLVLRYCMKNGADLGTLPVHLINAAGVDKLYEALQKGTRVDKRLRQANLCMGHMARAWDVVHRLYPKVVPSNNPFRGVELEHGKATTRAASRAEAYALHQALVAAGDPHLAAVPLICFEWHQRPENVLAGHLTWPDYRPSDRPNTVRIEHHKTGERWCRCRSRIATGHCFRNCRPISTALSGSASRSC